MLNRDAAAAIIDGCTDIRVQQNDARVHAIFMKFNFLAMGLCVTTLSSCATLAPADRHRPLFDPKEVVVAGAAADQHRVRLDTAQCEDEVKISGKESLATQFYVYRACLVKHNYRLVN